MGYPPNSSGGRTEAALSQGLHAYHAGPGPGCGAGEAVLRTDVGTQLEMIFAVYQGNRSNNARR